MDTFLFNLFAILTVASAAGVVLNRNTVASALSLLLCLVGVAGLFALLDAFLLAVLLVFVYAGAVVALFLFIIMLLDMQGGDRKPFPRATLVAGTLAGLLLATGVCAFATRTKLQLSVAHMQLAAGATGPEPVERVATLKNYAELL